MNLQELQYIRQEKLPIKIVVFNNYALGMIRHFQQMYLQGNYMQTVCGHGYGVPDFEGLAHAYHLRYFLYDAPEEIADEFIRTPEPALIEIKLSEPTYVFPKLRFGQPNQDQEPLLDRKLYDYLMEL